MTLVDKREVIEVLLCGWRNGCRITAIDIGASVIAGDRAANARSRATPRSSVDWDAWEWAAIEAAYRLIESSPTLVREWFGRGAA